MPQFIIDECEIPDNITSTGIIPTTITTTGANLFNFIPYRDTTEITYITGSAEGGKYVTMPAGAQIGDIAFFFDSVTDTSAIGTPSSSWTPFVSESFNSTGLVTGYFKVLRTSNDLTEIVTGSQTEPIYSEATKTLGVFRPNIPICTVNIDINPIVIQPPAVLDKTLSLSGITAPTIAFIWYWDHEGDANLLDSCYSSIPMNVLPYPDGLPGQIIRQVIKHKTYTEDEPRTDIECNLLSTNSFMTYFSVTLS